MRVGCMSARANGTWSEQLRLCESQLPQVSMVGSADWRLEICRDRAFSSGHPFSSESDAEIVRGSVSFVTGIRRTLEPSVESQRTLNI